jgi:hypothetical protein
MANFADRTVGGEPLELILAFMLEGMNSLTLQRPPT